MKYLKEIKERFHLPLAVMPLLETEINGLPMVDRAAQALFCTETIAYAEGPEA